jgi:hypothetical protein
MATALLRVVEKNHQRVKKKRRGDSNLGQRGRPRLFFITRQLDPTCRMTYFFILRMDAIAAVIFAASSSESFINELSWCIRKLRKGSYSLSPDLIHGRGSGCCG